MGNPEMAREKVKTAAPLVVVVTPVYNGDPLLAETMAGVQAQTYPNLVHVILDNASTDGTAAIIDSFEGGAVAIIRARNETLLPPDDSWNASLKFIPAEAAYFCVLCADDVLYPEAITRMVALAEADPAITCVGGAAMYNENTRDFGWASDRSVFDGTGAIRACFENLATLDPRLILFRRDALASADPFYDDSAGHASDIDATMRMLARGKFGFVHEPIAMLREHAGSVTATATRPIRRQFIDWLIILRRHGPGAFGAGYPEFERRYLRFYYRRMLRWRFKDNNRRAFDHHMQKLTEMSAKPGLSEFAGSGLDAVLKRVGLRKPWVGYPY
jgi:glycosyltransferase involved in cell wall biosynthesis